MYVGKKKFVVFCEVSPKSFFCFFFLFLPFLDLFSFGIRFDSFCPPFFFMNQIRIENKTNERERERERETHRRVYVF